MKEGVNKFMKKALFLFAYAFVALLVFAVGKSSEADNLSIALSGQYAKKMADASEKMTELEHAVNESLLFGQGNGMTDARETIWRLSSDIKNSVSSLPLEPEFATAWMNYLGRLGNYAKEADEGREEDYYKVMKQASGNLRQLSSEWQVATSGMLNGRLTMEEWQNRLSSEKNDYNWSATGASIKQYVESDFPLTASESDAMKKKELQDLDDATITEDEAVQQFQALFPNVSNDIIGVEPSKPGSPYPFYHIRFAEDHTLGYIDITKKGGHVLSFLSERTVGNPTLTFEEVKQRAEQFLHNARYDDVVFEEARENSNAWHMVFVRIEQKHRAKVYSDVIHLKVSKDIGDILGLDASEYIRKEQVKDQPIVSIDWKTFFRPNVKVVEEELAYIENEQLIQRLAYSLLVTAEENGHISTYKVMVDTETKEVIKTEKQS